MDRRVILKGAVDGLILAATGSAVFAAEKVDQCAATHNKANSAAKVQSKLRECVSVKEFGAVGDGITDDSACIQAALNHGAKIIIGSPTDNYSINSVTIPDGVAFDLNGATVTARSTSAIIVTGNECVVQNGTIDCANTRGTSAVNIDGSQIGIYMMGKSGLSVVNVTFTRFRKGIQATTKINGVYCSGLYVAGCTFKGYIYSSTIPNSGQIGIVVGSTVTENNTVIGTFSANWAEALLTNAIRIVGNKFIGGQYGIALHRCSDATVVGNDIREASRAISIQVQSRDISITANTVANCHTAGIHMSSGIRNCIVTGNVISGTMANDNVCIQAYYGCQDITISGNTLDSRFDQWAGGLTGDRRSPFLGIRTGQMCQNIKITDNFIRGFAIGIGAYTTVYSHILGTDPTYQRTGLQSIDIAGNKIIFDYQAMIPTLFQHRFLQSNSYGILINKLGAWESSALGGLGLSDISLDQNKIYNTQYPIVWQYTDDTSKSPVVRQYLSSRNNLAVSSVGGNAEVYEGALTGADVNSVGNSWADSNYQQWVTFIPTFFGLAVVNGTGGATYSGKYLKNGNTVSFVIYITTTGTCTTASTVGVTCCTVAGFTPAIDGVCFAANFSTGASYGVGVTNTSATPVVCPGWAATSSKIIISGQFSL